MRRTVLFGGMASLALVWQGFTAEITSTDHSVGKPPLTLRIVGSSVKSARGEYLGRIQEIVLNPYTSQAEFAMLLVGYPKNTSLVTPVPWSLLAYVSDQGQSGGEPGAEQIFQLDIDRARLVKAPTLAKTRWGLIAQPEWRQQIYDYYGIATEPEVAAVEETPPNPATFADGYPAVFTGPSVYTPFDTSYPYYDFFYSTGPVPWYPYYPYYPYPYYHALAGRSAGPAEYAGLFPGGTPVLPNGPDMFRAATNFYPGAPAPLPADYLPRRLPEKPLVPLKPGAPWSPLVPQESLPHVAHYSASDAPGYVAPSRGAWSPARPLRSATTGSGNRLAGPANPGLQSRGPGAVVPNFPRSIPGSAVQGYGPVRYSRGPRPMPRQPRVTPGYAPLAPLAPLAPTAQ